MRTFVSALLVTLTVGGCASARPARSAGVVNVVAAENFWGDVAAQIGGARVHVTSIIDDPQADPHLFDANARAAAAIARARLVVENGLGYDDQVDAVVVGSDAKVLNVADVLDVRGHDANPHLWYSVRRAGSVARAIGDALKQLDPAGAPEYDANVARFDTSLGPVLATIDTIKRRYAGAPVAYTERVAGYLLEDAGLDVRTPAGFARSVEEGSEPNPRDTRAVDDLISRRAVRVLVYNAQATSSTTQRVQQQAIAAHIPVVTVTETMPKTAPSYQAWQLAQARALLGALGG